MIPKNTWLTRPVRILIMCSLITLFFIISPIVIFYTAGYRFDWYSGRILQTGVISIDIEPRDARAVLNGVVIDKRIPIRLTNRAPGNYTLLLERDGYHSWEEIITVNSKETTYIRDITLFQESLPTRVAENSITENTTIISSPYPSDTILIHNTDDGVHEFGLYNTTEQLYTPLLRTAADERIMAAYSPHQTDKLVLQLQIDVATVHTYIVDLTNADISSPIISTTIEPFHWTESAAFALQNNNWVNIETGNSLNLTAARVPTDTTPEDWYIRVSTMVLRNPITSSTITLSDPIDTIIRAGSNYMLATYQDKILFFTLEGRQATLAQEWQNATIATYGDDLLITTPWDITAIRDGGYAELLLRTSNQIEYVSQLADDRPELIITHTDSIDIFDPRFNTMTTLTKNTALGGAMSNERETALYFYGDVGRGKGLFELEI